MKLNVKLTADELKNVTEAIAEEAENQGWIVCIDDPDLEDCLHIVDAALSAMGIEILEEEVEEEDDDDDEEEVNPIEEMVFIKDGKRTISQANATMLLNMVADCIMRDDRVPNDRKWEVTQGVFLAFAKDHGLECVEMSGE